MKLAQQKSLHAARLAIICLAIIGLFGATLPARSQAPSTTTITGAVYLANGQPGSGTLVLKWPSFTTAAGQLIAADSTTVTIPADGFVSVNLAPNLGATPAGQYYTAVYYMSDGSTSTQYWVVPAAAQATLAQVQAQVMPAAQAVQTVSKSYVDQSIAELAGSELTSSGGNLSGPLYLSGDPSQALQAADKHYVDEQVATAVPLTGGTLTGPLTATKIGAAYQVDQFPGVDFEARMQACLSAVSASYGGTCDARNFTGTQSMASSLTISTGNTTILLPCATIATASQLIVTAGTRNVALRGCALRGGSAASGSTGGTVFAYSGTGAMIQVGDPTYAVDTPGFHLDNVVINTTAATSATAQGLIAYRAQELDLESLYFLGNANQTGMTLDGTGNYTGGTFLDNELDGFGTAIDAIGHQAANPATTDWVNASTFVRLHIDCPTSGGNPIAGTYGINLQQGDGNTFTGGDVEGCATALHLGANAQNNTIVGLRNENSTNQVVADSGSSYNNWITGGTMFTGKLTDNGTRNSFLDTFHRSFNGLNGDWYGSQQDATVTNHYRLGIGAGNERGLLDEYQTDAGYRWTMGLSDATAGEQYYQILDQLNNVYRFQIGQYNSGQSSTNNQTVINAAGSGAVVLNGSNNAGTGGVIFGSGGPSESTVATIGNTGNAQFNGSLQVGGAAQAAGTMTVRNNVDAEVDYYLWPGLTASQKGSFTYKDWNGDSQWYMLKDASNNWALNSAVGGLDSFKAYQSANSGDTYIDASNATGHVRLNYETGSGAETDIYAGSSASLIAAFLAPSSIKFPGLAASSGKNCLQIDNSGYITNTGSACGSGGGSGTVNSGTTNQVALYPASGTTVQGSSTLNLAGTIGAAGVQDALRPWVDTFTLASGVGGATDECAKLAQLGINAQGVYTGNIFRSTGVSGTTVNCSTSPFASYLTAVPFTGTPVDTIIRLAPGTIYTIPSELDIPTGGEIDGQSTYTYYGTPRTGTWLEPSSAFPLASASSPAGNVLVNMGPSSSTTAPAFSLSNTIHGLGVDCLGYPDASGILNGQGQQGTIVYNDAVRDCQFGIDVENYGNGAGGAQNHGPVYGDGVIPASAATTLFMTGAQVTAGGSYTQAPAVTVTGCTTNPSYQAVLTGTAVTSLVAGPPNYYGSGCSPGTTAISFGTAYGSGAAATPVIQNFGAAVGLRLGAVKPTGGGLYSNDWVVGSSYPVNQNIGMTLDDTNEYVLDFYSESNWKGLVVGSNRTSAFGGDVILGARTQGANEPTETVVDLANNAAGEGIAILGVNNAGDTHNYLTDEQPNGGACSNDLASQTGVPLYVRNGQSVLSTCRGIATTGQVLANSFLNCGSCTAANQPRQFLPGKNAGGYVQSMPPGDVSEGAGIGYNGIFDTTHTHRSAFAYSGQTPCIFDTSAPINAGDFVGTSSNTVVSGQSVAGCVDLGSSIPSGYTGWVWGQVVYTGSTASFSIPSVPSVSGATVTGSAANGVTRSYEITVSVSDGSKTESAASAAMTDANGPNALVANATETIAGIPASGVYNIYRTISGSSSLPSLTPVMVNGELAQIGGLPAGSGYTFAPTAVFSGGGCTTLPHATFFVEGGAISTYTITNPGAGCTSTPTLTLTKSVCETGKIGQFSGTTFADHGFCADGSTPPASGIAAPLIGLAMQPAPTASAGGNMVGAGPVTSGDVPEYNGATGTDMQDSGIPAANLTANTAPLWLQYLGTGADGAESVTSGSVALSGEKYYTSFNVSAGATVTVSNALVIHSTGACTINGTILANGATNILTQAGLGGGASGGSGGGAAAGGSGKSSYLSPALAGVVAANPGAAGGSGGGAATNGQTPTPNAQRVVAASGLGMDGVELSGAESSVGANSGGAAMAGGGGVVLICASISGTGTIDVSGAPGNPPDANSEGASGGAGGGVAILSSQAAVSSWPAIDTGGGAGGQVSVPYAAPTGTSATPSGDQCSTPPVLALGVSGGALNSCTVTIAGGGCGASPSINWTILGGGGSGGTITPTWSGGAVASCTASGGSGYTAAAYTTAGTGGNGGNGWSAEYSGW